jgi:type I restriction enzyme, R subunit
MLTRNVKKGHSDEMPTQLDTPGKRALYNNLMRPVQEGMATGETAAEYTVLSDQALMQAVQIDAAVKKVRPDDWRGVQPREQVIKRALYDILKDYDEVERIFKIIFQQHEY